MPEGAEKEEMKDLYRRLIVHIRNSIDRSQGNAIMLKELVFSFFLHIQGIHRWRPMKFSDIIRVEPNTKACSRFFGERFSSILECPHITDSTIESLRNETTSPESPAYQKLLSYVGKATFMTDMDKIRPGKLTPYNESFNNIRIKYCPKQSYFPIKSFEIRTMLAVLHWNTMQRAELCGERRISEVIQVFSKSKQTKVMKIKKEPTKMEWKKRVVESARRKKEEQGMGDPVNDSQVNPDEESELLFDDVQALLDFMEAENNMEDSEE
uniref:Uncharacterized protein n=1 Tax=Acrobeloides nanus TaxID=290746 RepID=A0A914DSM7_9BILA